MIKSITFNGDFGYISEKIPEPECPVRGYNTCGYNEKYRSFSDEEKQRIKQYKKEVKEWKKHKDDYNNPTLVKNLINRKFEFEEGKINLIFGPNGSGKTTIIKALSGIANVEDGFTKLEEPFNLFKQTTFKTHIERKMRNSANFEWDGAPIYYDNFANRQNRGNIGDLTGSLLGDVVDEALYIMNKGRQSLGENTIFLFQKLYNIVKNPISFADIFSKYINEDGSYNLDYMNDIWQNAFSSQLDYFMSFPKSKIKSPITLLCDELDKSLDIQNTYFLYTTILPELCSKTGIQIITVSHSPLVLSDKIKNNEHYNFISLDEEYTQNCICKMQELFTIK